MGDSGSTEVLTFRRDGQQEKVWTWIWKFKTSAGCPEVDLPEDDAVCDFLVERYSQNLAMMILLFLAIIANIYAAVAMILMATRKMLYRSAPISLFLSFMLTLSELLIFIFSSLVGDLSLKDFPDIEKVSIGTIPYLLLGCSVMDLMCFIHCRYFFKQLEKARLVVKMFESMDHDIEYEESSSTSES